MSAPHPILRIWPGYVRSPKHAASVAGLEIIDVPAGIPADPGDKQSRELACTQGHCHAMRAFLESDWPFCVVFEDDAIVHDRAWMSFTEFDLFMPFVHPGAYTPPAFEIVPGKLPWRGTQAYLASRNFAEAYLPLLAAGGISDHAYHVAVRGLNCGRYAGNVVQHDLHAPSMICNDRRRWQLHQIWKAGRRR